MGKMIKQNANERVDNDSDPHSQQRERDNQANVDRLRADLRACESEQAEARRCVESIEEEMTKLGYDGAPSETNGALSETNGDPSETNGALSETNGAPSETNRAPSDPPRIA